MVHGMAKVLQIFNYKKTMILSCSSDYIFASAIPTRDDEAKAHLFSSSSSLSNAKMEIGQADSSQILQD